MIRLSSLQVLLTFALLSASDSLLAQGCLSATASAPMVNPWGSATVPPTTTLGKNVTTTAGSTLAVVAACNNLLAGGQISSANLLPGTTVVAANCNITGTRTLGSPNITNVVNTTGLTVGQTVTWPGFPAGITILAISGPGPGATITLSSPASAGGAFNVAVNYVVLSQPASASGLLLSTFTLPPHPSNAPPNGTGISGIPTAQNCSVCPATFQAPICAGEYFPYYMCAGQTYTFSLCGSLAAWNSNISITNGWTALATGYPSPAFDDNSCGAPSQHAIISFSPQTSNTYNIRVFADPCATNSGLCGSMFVQCAPNPTPPLNDTPTNATALPYSQA